MLPNNMKDKFIAGLVIVGIFIFYAGIKYFTDSWFGQETQTSTLFASIIFCIFIGTYIYHKK